MTINGTAVASSGALARQDAFGSSELAVSAEVQSAALAAQAEAEVKARWAIAQRNPRNIDGVRLALLRECERPGFAEVAKYAKPVGADKPVVGPSIRFVEAALRCMGNIVASTTLVAEDARTRRLQVMVTDLETNVSWPRQITIEKTVERKDATGRTVLSERTNSWGKKVYVVVATEDELGNKEAAAVSKAIRTAGLRVLPGDLIEEALRKVDEVRNNTVKRDPAGERKKLVDGFASIGVSPEQIVEYLGHTLDFCQPAELGELRDIYAAIRDSETTWRAVMADRREDGGTSAPPPPQKTPPAPTETAPVTSPPYSSSAAPASTPPPPPPLNPNGPPLNPNGPPLDEKTALLALIDSAANGKDLATRIGPAITRASPEVRSAVMPAYQAKAQSLRGGK